MLDTLSAQIIRKHLVDPADEVSVGRYVSVSVDKIVLNDGGAPTAFASLEAMGGGLKDPRQLVLVLDHFVPAPTLKAARNLNLLRRFADAQPGVSLFELGRGGIEHALLPEKGLISGGDLVVAGDSHACTMGSVGTLGLGLGSTDIAACATLGETWMRVPNAIRVQLVGERPADVAGKDVAFSVLSILGQSGALNSAVEYGGPALTQFSIDDRAALCNMAAEMSADTAICEPDPVSHAWHKEKGVDEFLNPVRSLDGYDRVIEIDVATVQPSVALPGSPANVVPISSVPRTKVDQVYIGNCSNGTITDLRAAAAVLKGAKVADETRLTIVPATNNILEQAQREGLLEIFIAAGALISPSTCGACFGGHMGLADDGDVVVANVNRNYPGRMGSKEAKIYLVGTLGAAIAATRGWIGGAEL